MRHLSLVVQLFLIMLVAIGYVDFHCCVGCNGYIGCNCLYWCLHWLHCCQCLLALVTLSLVLVENVRFVVDGCVARKWLH